MTFILWRYVMGKWIAGAGIVILVIAAVINVWSEAIAIVYVGLAVVFIGVIWWLIENLFCKK